MKKITLLSVILLLLAQLGFSQIQAAKRISIPNPSALTLQNIKKAGIDLSCGPKFVNNNLQMELSNTEISRLDNIGISYNVVIDDLTTYYKEKFTTELPLAKAALKQEQLLSQIKNASKTLSKKSSLVDNPAQHDECSEIDWATPSNFKLGSMGGALTLSEAYAELDLMRSMYPNLISVRTDASTNNTKTHGNTTGGTTWSGQPIYYVRISDNPDTDEANEPETLITGAMHAREISSVMNTFYFMWYILENYSSDPFIKNMVDNQEIYIMPISNPDGYRWNEVIAPTGGGLQRKNLRPWVPADGGSNNNNGTTNSNNDVRGVDLNRNFNYYWGWDNSGSSPTPTSHTYRGPSAGSEPETQIVQEFIAAHDIKVAVNHHGGLNSIVTSSYNGSISATDSGREDEYAKICHDLTHYNRYIYGSAPNTLYEANGDVNDWMFGGPNVTSGGQTSSGSGKDVLALTPENGDDFWPTTTLIVDIARRAMRMNLISVMYSGKFAKLHDFNTSDIISTSGNLTFGLEYLGKTYNDITLTVTPVSSNITSMTSPGVQSSWTKLEQRNLNVPFTLNAGIQPNDEIEFQVTLSNDDFIIYRANYVKYYQPTVLFQDNDTNTSNWTTSGGTWGTTSDAHVGSVAITDSPSGAYSNNQNKAITLNSTMDLSGYSHALVQFYAKWDLERNYDMVQLEASTNGGSSWTALCGRYNKPAATSLTNFHLNKTTGTHQSSNGEIVYDGDSMNKWVMEEILINNDDNTFLLGQSNAQFRFRFKTDSSNREDDLTTTFDGFIFDDFKILGIEIPCVTDIPINLTTSNITSTTASVSWDNIPSATYDLRYKATASSTWIDVNNITTSSYPLTGLTTTTDYELQVRSKCNASNSTYSTSANFTTTAPTYCDADGDDGTFFYIDNVTLGTINNNSAASGTGYSDFKALSNSMMINSSETISISKFYTGPQYNLATSVWIDFNKDGDFLDAGEQVLTNGSSTTSPVTSNITIPNDASLGSTRMRIILKYYNSAGQTATNSCESFTYGEVEDYTVNISSNSTTWYQDLDSDTFGNPAVSQTAPTQPAGYVADNTDCDDNDADEFPGQTWYIGVDNDNDTFFGSVTSTTACEQPAGYSLTAPATDDCDDNDADEFPGQTWYIGVDNDNDTFFGSVTSTTACEQPAGYSLTAPATDDCDDNDADEFPGQTWYIGVDNDNDTFFGSVASTTACEQPAGYSLTAPATDDCDDNDADEFPGQTWYIGVDNDNDTFFGNVTSTTACEQPAGYSLTAPATPDCDDNDADEFPGQTWYIGVDNDNDTFFGSVTSTTACEQPAGYSLTAPATDDCDDNDADEFPGQTWYIGVDNDNDTFFGSVTSTTACEQPAGYSLTAPATPDCDDNDADEFPGQTWYIGVDNDNDTFFGSVTSTTACEQPAGYSLTAPATPDCDDNDADEFPGQTWYIGVDNDNDTFFGSVTSTNACEQPAGYSLTAPATDDCDDNDADEFPGQTWYIGVDNDNDTFFGSVTSTTACEQPAGYSLTAPATDDCDDADNTIYPGALEVANDGIDQDCDGSDETTLDTVNIDLNDIVVTPNPFNDNVVIKLPSNLNNSEFNIKVFDLNGRLMIDRKYFSINNQIKIYELDKLDQALYLFKISNTKTGLTSFKKLIKY